MVVTMMQQSVSHADSSNQSPPLYVRLAFGPYDTASAKSNVVQSLRGVAELYPRCKRGRTVMLLPFLKSNLLQQGLHVSDVALLGNPDPNDLLWNITVKGLTVTLDANTRLFDARLFGPSSLPAVFKISFAR
eukprot:SAG31_NODE_6493_length_1997_cov_2.064805_1_plen_132_part_00